MKLLTFRGERSVTDINKRVFRRLTARQQEKADAALLKANPQLQNLKKLAKGTVIRVPELPELDAKRKTNSEGPADQISDDLVATLKTFSETFGKRVKQESRNIKTQASLLKNSKFKKAISRSTRSKALAASTAKSVGARSKIIAAREKTLQASVNQLLRDLKKKTK